MTNKKQTVVWCSERIKMSYKLNAAQKHMWKNWEQGLAKDFGAAFYDVFREHWNADSDSMGDLFAQYVTIGHKEFMAEMEKTIKGGFRRQCDSSALWNLENNYTEEDLKGWAYLERKKEDLLKELAEINLVLEKKPSK